MDRSIIATRELVCHNKNGEFFPFIISIRVSSQPDETDQSYEIFSGDILFKGIKRVYGIDSIDSLDYAIQLIDSVVEEFSGGKIVWPDGTPYKRVSTNTKMAWG